MRKSVPPLGGSVEFLMQLPVVVVRYQGSPSDAAFDAYLERMRQVCEQHVGCVLVHDATFGGPADAVRRRRLADFIKDNTPLIQRNVAGVAYVVPNALVRGIVVALLWMVAHPVPHLLTDSLDEGMQWAGRTAVRHAAKD